MLLRLTGLAMLLCLRATATPVSVLTKRVPQIPEGTMTVLKSIADSPDAGALIRLIHVPNIHIDNLAFENSEMLGRLVEKANQVFHRTELQNIQQVAQARRVFTAYENSGIGVAVEGSLTRPLNALEDQIRSAGRVPSNLETGPNLLHPLDVDPISPYRLDSDPITPPGPADNSRLSPSLPANRDSTPPPSRNIHEMSAKRPSLNAGGVSSPISAASSNGLNRKDLAMGAAGLGVLGLAGAGVAGVVVSTDGQR